MRVFTSVLYSQGSIEKRADEEEQVKEKRCKVISIPVLIAFWIYKTPSPFSSFDACIPIPIQGTSEYTAVERKHWNSITLFDSISRLSAHLLDAARRISNDQG